MISYNNVSHRRGRGQLGYGNLFELLLLLNYRDPLVREAQEDQWVMQVQR